MQACESTDPRTVKARAELEGIISYVKQRDSWLKQEHGEAYNSDVSKCAFMKHKSGRAAVFVGVALNIFCECYSKPFY